MKWTFPESTYYVPGTGQGDKAMVLNIADPKRCADKQPVRTQSEPYTIGDHAGRMWEHREGTPGAHLE